MKALESNVSDKSPGDLVLREVWQIKDLQSAARGHDIDRLFEEARGRHKRSGRPAVNLQERKPRAKPVPASAA
jgi:hypothetical protein